MGEPSWVLGSRSLADGRTHFAKRYTVVVKSEDLFDELMPDWTDFKRSDAVDNVYAAVDDYVKNVFIKMIINLHGSV